MNAARIRTAALLCAAVLCMPLAACGKNNESNHAQAADLTKDIKVQSVTGTDADERFCAGQTAFALHLLQETLRTDEKNVLISPYWVTQALAMTANGAKGNTLAQMEQVFFNLLKNALEAMKDGGVILITVSADDNDVIVKMRDSGAGMTPEQLAHLFEPYRTSKSGGSGLGLMVTARIVHDHGGTIDAESEVGKGSTFTVRLPRIERRIRELK